MPRSHRSYAPGRTKTSAESHRSTDTETSAVSRTCTSEQAPTIEPPISPLECSSPQSQSGPAQECVSTASYDLPLRAITDLERGDGLYWIDPPRTARPLVVTEPTTDPDQSVQLIGPEGGEYSLSYWESILVIERYGRIDHPRQLKPPGRVSASDAVVPSKKATAASSLEKS